MKSVIATLFAFFVLGALLSGCLGTTPTSKEAATITEQVPTTMEAATPAVKVTSAPKSTTPTPAPQPSVGETTFISDEEIQDLEADLADVDDFLSDLEDIDIDISILDLEAFS